MDNAKHPGIDLCFFLYVLSSEDIALDALWHLSPKPGVSNSLWAAVKICSLAYIIAILAGLSFLALLFCNTAINMSSNLLQNKFNLDFSSAQPFINIISSPIIYTGIFLIAFRYLLQENSRFIDLIPGAFLTAVPYWVGIYLYTLYLNIGSGITV
jgi:uncharacterized BrkB/YihY/UPF0761 family membrane protein